MKPMTSHIPRKRQTALFLAIPAALALCWWLGTDAAGREEASPGLAGPEGVADERGPVLAVEVLDGAVPSERRAVEPEAIGLALPARLDYETAVSTSSVQEGQGMQALLQKVEVRGRLELEVQRATGEGFEAVAHMAEAQVLLSPPGIPGADSLAVGMLVGLERRLAVHLMVGGASVAADPELPPLEQMGQLVLVDLLSRVPLAPIEVETELSTLILPCAMGAFEVEVRDVVAQPDERVVALHRLRLLPSHAPQGMRIEIPESEIRVEPDARHGWTGSASVQETLIVREQQSGFAVRQVFSAELSLLDVEPLDLILATAAARVTDLLDRIGELAQRVDPRDAALFAAVDELGDLLRSDAAALEETLEALRDAHIDPAVAASVFQALEAARRPEATLFLLDQINCEGVSDAWCQGALAALPQVDGFERGAALLDETLPLDADLRRALLQRVLLGMDAPASERDLMDDVALLEQPMRQAGAGAAWLDLLAATEGEAAAARIEVYLEDEDPTLRAAAARMLAGCAGKTCVDALARLLDREQDGAVRSEALRALAGAAGDDDMQRVAEVLRREGDPETRARAIASLSDPRQVRPQAVALVRALALQDPDPEVREQAALALGM